MITEYLAPEFKRDLEQDDKVNAIDELISGYHNLSDSEVLQQSSDSNCTVEKTVYTLCTSFIQDVMRYPVSSLTAIRKIRPGIEAMIITKSLLDAAMYYTRIYNDYRRTEK